MKAAMRDLTALVDTVDCVTPGCSREADRPDGLCRACRTVPNSRPEPLPLRLKPGALAHLMDDDEATTTPAHPTPQETTMADPPCRITGCTRTATHNVGARGVYGTLCDEHYQQQRSRQGGLRSSPPKPSPAAPKPARAPREAPPGGTTTLTTLAQQADQALADLTAARQRYQQAVDALKAALEREAI